MSNDFDFDQWEFESTLSDIHKDLEQSKQEVDEIIDSMTKTIYILDTLLFVIAVALIYRLILFIDFLALKS